MKAQKTIYLFALALILTGCVTDPFGGEPDGGSETPHDMSINFITEGFGGAAAQGTRADGTVDESAVSDVWVFQFNGIGDDAPLITPQRYTTDITGSFAFADGGDTEQLVAFVANTGDPKCQWGFEAGKSTFADLKNYITAISEESDLYPGGKLKLFGTAKIYTNGTQSQATVQMKHSAARIVVKVTNNAAGITIKKIQVCNVPAQASAAEPAIIASAPYPEPEKTDYIDYALSDAEIANGADDTFTFYVNPNLQGTVENDNPKLKKAYAPVNATYVKILAVNTSEGDRTIEYDFHPGVNTTNDYNVRINNSYEMDITIEGTDDYSVDGRITEIVSFAGKQANSYILNPPAVGATSFRVYPLRADIFWGPGYANVPEKILGSTGAWEVELLWMNTRDMASRTDTDKIRITKGSGTGVSDYFEITVPSTALHGNFTISVYKAGDAEKSSLWSWHFWVTDYNPNISALTPKDKTYSYKVSGGNVHRYGGSNWETGAYSRSFIMDRNLGQLEIDPSLQYTMNTSTGGSYIDLIMPGQNSLLYYQFGRKDPFTAHPMKIARDIDDNLPITNSNYTTTLPDKPSGDYFSSTNAEWQTLAVSSPTKMIFGAYYMANNNNLSHWGDSNYARGEAKSLFDPCPPGWKVPQADIFQDFYYGRTLMNASRGMVYQNGFQYWPMVEVDGSYPVQDVIFFPSAGYLSSIYPTELGTDNVYLLYAHGSPYDGRSKAVQYLYMYRNSFDYEKYSSSFTTLRAMPVRCISEQ